MSLASLLIFIDVTDPFLTLAAVWRHIGHRCHGCHGHFGRSFLGNGLMGPWPHRLLGTARQPEVTIAHFGLWELAHSRERVVQGRLDFLLKMLLAAAGTLPVPKGVTGDLLMSRNACLATPCRAPRLPAMYSGIGRVPAAARSIFAIHLGNKSLSGARSLVEKSLSRPEVASHAFLDSERPRCSQKHFYPGH